MKRAANIFCWIAILALLFSMMSCGMARQFNWNEAAFTGVCALGVAGLCGLVAAILTGIGYE